MNSGTVDDKVWDEARSRAGIVARTLPDAPIDQRLSLAEAARELGVDRSTVFRWRARFETERRLSALLPKHRGRPKGHCQVDPRVDELVETQIQTFYLRPERPSIRELVERIRAECNRIGLPPPHWRTVRLRIKRVDARKAMTRREGAAAARAAFTPVVEEYRSAGPLDVVQIDHTIVDLIVVDEVTRTPIGRPVLTLAIDIHTRVVTGFYLGLDHPSILRAGVCVAQSVFEKGTWLAERGIDLPWPVSGLPRAVHVDNAGEFHSSAFTRTLEDFGVEVIYRPIARPHFGGHVERLIGTTMGAVHVLRGTTFSSVRDRANYPSEGRATMTLRELERWLALEILGKYHHRVHSALKRPPLAVWSELAVSSPPRMPKDRIEFLAGLLPYEMRLPRRDGFHLFNVRYWSDALVKLLGRHEQKLMVRYDPRDLSRVWIRRPDGRHVEARYKNLGREPISLWEHGRAMERLRAQGRKEVSEEILFRAIREQRRIEDEAFKLSRRARRAASQRPAAQVTVPVAPPAPDLGVIDTSDPNLPTLPLEIIDGRRRG
jgi:putative transposase